MRLVPSALSAIALTVEFSRIDRRNFNNALMFSGYAVGGILAALLSLAFLGELPHLYHAVAFLLIVGGIVLSSRR